MKGVQEQVEKPNGLEPNDGVVEVELRLEEVRVVWPMSVGLDNDGSRLRKLARIDQEKAKDLQVVGQNVQVANVEHGEQERKGRLPIEVAEDPVEVEDEVVVAGGAP